MTYDTYTYIYIYIEREREIHIIIPYVVLRVLNYYYDLQLPSPSRAGPAGREPAPPARDSSSKAVSGGDQTGRFFHPPVIRLVRALRRAGRKQRFVERPVWPTA